MLAGFLWPNGRVPYTIADDFNATQRAVIESAIASYNDEFPDCIAWVPRQSSQLFYILEKHTKDGITIITV